MDMSPTPYPRDTVRIQPPFLQHLLKTLDSPSHGIPTLPRRDMSETSICSSFLKTLDSPAHCNSQQPSISMEIFETSHSMSTLFCSAFLAISIAITPVYASTDDDNSTHVILLNCGSSETVLSEDGVRKFVGDRASKFAPPTSTEATASASASAEALYMTARLFAEKSTYKVPISDTAQRHFLRLHFHPSSYNGLNSTDAVFSVNCGPYALLHNFTPQALNQSSIVMEFCIHASKQKHLDIIFTPEANNPKSYAFINAMEIISISNQLFEKPARLSNSHYPIPFPITLNTAMQNMYRLNVGGQFISPANDKYGRIWYDDSPYIFGAATGTTGTNITKIQQEDIFAPEPVYATYRSMHPDSTINLNFNLTWIFSNIDANFSYLVRLHFCEIQFDKSKQRTFDIYINNQTVQEGFDVAAAASGPNRPIYEDYEVNVPADNSGTTDMWVALHPNKETEPQYYNAILNGLEIFKFNDSSGNLAGPNHVVTKEVVENSNEPKSSSSRHTGYMIGAVSGSLVAAVSLLSLMIFCLVRKRKNKSIKNSCEKPFTTVAVHGEGTTSTSKENTESSAFTGSYSYGSISVAGIFCRYFSLAEIQNATSNFDDSLLLGVGGFGKVYKGEIGDGIRVAVKRVNPKSLQGSREFKNEIGLLSRLRHKHLVSLIGYCDQNSEMCLVYDYVPNGSLHKYLNGKDHGSNVLSWKQRLEICIGAAKGLDYLHSGAFQTVIHRDVKSTNILLDENLDSKVSDFGLSKTVGSFDQSHVTTMVKGSFGYMDPEYFYTLALTKKSDVYSFGVVLFEVLCAKPAVMSSQWGGKINLSDYALEYLREDALEQIIDPDLIGDITSDSLDIFARVGQKCLAEIGDERPSMADVVWQLELARQLHDTATCQGEIIDGVNSHGSLKINSTGESSKWIEVADTAERVNSFSNYQAAGESVSDVN